MVSLFNVVNSIIFFLNFGILFTNNIFINSLLLVRNSVFLLLGGLGNDKYGEEGQDEQIFGHGCLQFGGLNVPFSF